LGPFVGGSDYGPGNVTFLGLYSKGKLEALPPNIKLMRNSLIVSNTLAYYGTALFTTVKVLEYQFWEKAKTYIFLEPVFMSLNQLTRQRTNKLECFSFEKYS
jgi:hypothetical protein